MSSPTILIIAVAIIAAAFFSRKAPANSKKTQVAVFCLLSLSFTIILLIVVSITGSFFRLKSNTTVDNHTRQAERVAPVEDKQPTPEELAEQQRLAEERRLAEEKRRQQEEIRQQRLAEERAAREAERNERRPTIDEFESRFLSIIGADVMGEAQTFSNRTTYPLDATGEVTLTEIFKEDRVNSVEIYVKQINKDSVIIALLAYYDAIRAHNPDVDINAVARGLSLDETILDNLTKPQTTNINGILYSKRVANKALVLSISY